MDPVAVTLVLTFIVMLATAALTMPVQQPPLYRRHVICPEDRQEATVALSWDVAHRRMSVVGCSHRDNGPCLETCAPALQTAFPELLPSVVIP